MLSSEAEGEHLPQRTPQTLSSEAEGERLPERTPQTLSSEAEGERFPQRILQTFSSEADGERFPRDSTEALVLLRRTQNASTSDISLATRLCRRIPVMYQTQAARSSALIALSSSRVSVVGAPAPRRP